ncbi:reverse transcriptase [Caerostris extrusa]|uniref:Reverse transcriptase n=1 Tax=Caerostris extrusa TaxID=172846 RepID=A0AAV4XJI4_CAEEX|nr:reverse transcriptase [Caerostris extrusa]
MLNGPLYADDLCHGADDVESAFNLSSDARPVLSTAAKVFDPVGFLSPFVVRIKRLMQEIWERRLDWDSKLREDLESKWKKWCAEIEVSGEMKIERCYFSNVVGKLDSVEVHIFSDASIVAYGAVAYFGYVNLREVGTSFVMSKCRISPLKKLSLPRLELMGALTAARLWKYLSKGVFVVLVDGDCTSPDRWKFCPGLENPADKLTRGENSHTLLNDSVWWQCPVWLRGSRNQWPRQKFERVTDEQKLEKLNTSVHTIFPQTEMILDENKFSNLRKLLRVTAWVKRFVAKLRKRLARVER